ncbi:MAG: hypothetical protein COC01_01610 [Bacteroidetes bacterium]|nr:MAG: hypothetical protein COC01_01610 [Bacteroidota bacterium]
MDNLNLSCPFKVGPAGFFRWELCGEGVSQEMEGKEDGNGLFEVFLGHTPDDLRNNITKGIALIPGRFKSGIGQTYAKNLYILKDKVEINVSEKGFLGKVSSLAGASDCELYYSDITSVKFYKGKGKGNLSMNGYISFMFAGKQDKSSGIGGMFNNLDQGIDPYTVYFPAEAADLFKGAVDLINLKIREHKQPQSSPVIIQKTEGDIPAQIKKLHDLQGEGIITKEEFESKKNELLAKM